MNAIFHYIVNVTERQIKKAIRVLNIDVVKVIVR